MSEIMTPLRFSNLMEHILGEYEETGSIFGIRRSKFYRNESSVTMERYDVRLDSPLGPAAGPGSQLAENIVAAFLAGSRFIELKTVQTMDGEELRKCVPRPCINAMDECYNVEWSTELTVEQARDEYIKAWIAVQVLAREFELGNGMVFNMSVGYSLEGIQSKKIDAYLEALRDASETEVWKQGISWLKANLNRFNRFSAEDLEALSSKVSDSVTLSTLHGCPSDEIERIASYLLSTKHLHTCIKCNPTLLGYESARELLDALGYDYVMFDDHHFKEDLQFDEAVAMIGRLQETAASQGLDFGLKITNTFPVQIKNNELPGEEMYMSGRSLFPLSITTASRLADACNGKLHISYSGGMDAFNLADILATGIRPITLATSLLKPGGYERLTQLAQIAERNLDAHQDELDVEALRQLAQSLPERERLRKDYRGFGSRKSEKSLPLIDCMVAPCSSTGCPIEQQIPAYLEQVAAEQPAEAFEIIVNDNVLPSTTGTICDHQCQNYCTRVDCDDSLQIREAKKYAVVAAQQEYLTQLQPTPLQTSEKVLVIGAGPAGIACASYLRRNGVEVDVRERRSQPMGIVSAVIPGFRISQEETDLDVDLARAYGVHFEFGADPSYNLAELRKHYRFIVLATGAWLPGSGDIQTEDAQTGAHVLDALDFLERSKASGCSLPLGSSVAVIGGGDVAMDCARAAMRNEGVRQVTLLYRRRRAQMPAQPEEVMMAQQEGVELIELHQPVSFADGCLICEIMQLGEPDTSGRPCVLPTGEQETLSFDTVIQATGARVNTEGFTQNALELNAHGFVALTENNESSQEGIYVIGDCKAGPKTVVKAMADAKIASRDILKKLGREPDFKHFSLNACQESLREKKGELVAATQGVEHAPEDAERCLGCNLVCEICVDVCPNRANVTLDLGEDKLFKQRYQILHIDRLCNECGNCATFCPTAGKPYRDKMTLYSSREDFEHSENAGFLALDDNRYLVRLADGIAHTVSLESNGLPYAFETMLRKVAPSYL